MAQTIRLVNLPSQNEKPNHVENLHLHLRPQTQHLPRNGLRESLADRLRQIAFPLRLYLETHLTHQAIRHRLQGTRPGQEQLLQLTKTR